MPTNPIYPATNNAQAVDLNILNSNVFHNVVNGDINTEVDTFEGNGKIPSVLKAIHEMAVYKAPIPWVSGGVEVDLLQVRTFGGFLFVPTSVPAPMDSTPSEAKWKLYMQSISAVMEDAGDNYYRETLSAPKSTFVVPFELDSFTYAGKNIPQITVYVQKEGVTTKLDATTMTMGANLNTFVCETPIATGSVVEVYAISVASFTLLDGLRTDAQTAAGDASQNATRAAQSAAEAAEYAAQIASQATVRVNLVSTEGQYIFDLGREVNVPTVNISVHYGGGYIHRKEIEFCDAAGTTQTTGMTRYIKLGSPVPAGREIEVAIGDSDESFKNDITLIANSAAASATLAVDKATLASTKATEAVASASNAEASKSAALTYSNNAATSLQSVYNVTNAAFYDNTKTYNVGDCCFASNMQTYRCRENGVVGFDPVANSSKWAALTSSTMPIGTVIPVMCGDTYTPNGCLPCNGAEYAQAQFSELWANYLTSSPAKLLTCTYAEYATSVTTYGSCGKFGVDTATGKFKVPLLADGDFIANAKSASELGKAYNAGLPNITGSGFLGATNTSYAGAFTRPANTASFAIDESSLYGLSYDTNALINHFNASLCSSIYGNSTTVTPEHIRLRYFVVVASGSINQSQMDWSAWATGLTGKANTDLTNATAIPQPILKTALNATGDAPVYACRAWVNFNGIGTVSVRASGNVSSVTDNGTGDYTVNFISQMPDANYSTSISGQRTGSGIYNGTMGIFAGASPTQTPTGVRVTTSGTDGTSPVDYLVINVSIFR